MERAKKLELGNQNSDTTTPSGVTESAPPADTQLSTQAGWELAEIVSAWPRLRPKICGAMLTLARVAAAGKRPDIRLPCFRLKIQAHVRTHQHSA